jgi:hypothetical protein
MRRFTVTSQKLSIHRAHRRAARPWTIALCGFLALAIQCFVVQTHIHIPGEATGLDASVAGKWSQAVSLAVQARTVAGTPADQPHDKYPLCQELSNAGHFIASAPILVALPVSVAPAILFFAEIATDTAAISHSWHSRGPPHI